MLHLRSGSVPWLPPQVMKELEEAEMAMVDARRAVRYCIVRHSKSRYTARVGQLPAINDVCSDICSGMCSDMCKQPQSRRAHAASCGSTSSLRYTTFAAPLPASLLY